MTLDKLKEIINSREIDEEVEKEINISLSNDVMSVERHNISTMDTVAVLMSLLTNIMQDEIDDVGMQMSMIKTFVTTSLEILNIDLPEEALSSGKTQH